MADAKNYIVNYEINSVGNAATAFKSMADQATTAEANIQKVAKQIKFINQALKLLNANEPLKNIWNINPTVNTKSAKSQLTELEQLAQASAERIEGIMGQALGSVGNKKGLSAKKQIAQVKKEMKELEDEFRRQTTSPSNPNGFGITDKVAKGRKGVTQELMKLRETYRNHAKILAGYEKLNKAQDEPHAASNIKSLADKAKNINNAANAITKLQRSVEKFSMVSGKTPTIKIDADISLATAKLNSLLSSIRNAREAIPVTVSDTMTGKNGKAISEKNGKLTKLGQNNAAAAEKAVVTKAEKNIKSSIALAKGQYETLEKSFLASVGRLGELSQRAPVVIRSVFNGGDAAMQLNQSLTRLQELANSKPVVLTSRLSASNINSAISQANMTNKGRGGSATKPIDLPVRMMARGVASQLKAIAGNAQSIADRQKKITLKINIQKGAIAGQLRKIISDADKLAPAQKGIGLKVNLQVNANTLTSQLNKAVKQLQIQANRTPVNIKASFNGSNLISQLNSTVASLEKAVSKVASIRMSDSSVGTRNGAAIQERNRRVRGGNTYVGTEKPKNISAGTRALQGGEDFYSRQRALWYPFTGNTSFGARTPMLVDMAKGMGTMFAVGGAMSAVGSSISQAVQYQNQMRTTKAILQNGTETYTPQGFMNMEHTVRDVGRRTKFTAPDVANAARFMSMAGLDIPAINAAIRPVADIALIGDTDLGTTADKLTNVMTTFGIAPEKMRDVADIMTSTFTRTNTDMMMLAESAKYAGGIAHLYGGNFKNNFADVMAIFGVLGNAGIQASSAGTTVRMMYQNLMQPNKNQAKVLKKYGIFTRDKNGQPLEMADIIHQIHNKVPKNQMADAVGSMFRITAQPGAATLASHVDTLDRIIQANRSAAGTNVSGQIALEKQNTIAGLWAQVTSTFTEGIVKAFENREGGWAKMLADARDYLARPETVEMISSLVDLVENLAKIMAKYAKFWVQVYNMAPGLINFWMKSQLFFTQMGYLITPVISLIGVFSTLKNVIVGLARVGTAASASLAGRPLGTGAATAAGSVVASTGRRASALGRFGARYATASGIVGAGAMALAQDRKWRYEVARNRLRNSVVYHGQRTDVSPLWYGTMAQFGLNAVEANRWMNERSKFANTNIEARQAAARRADAAVMRQQAIVNGYRQDLRRPRQIRNPELVARYQSRFGTAANATIIAQAAQVQQAKAMYRNTSQMTNKELLERFHQRGGKGALGLGMKGAFKRGVDAGTIGRSFAGIFDGIKSGFYSLMTGMAKAVGLLVSPVGLATIAVGGMAAIALKLYSDSKKYKEQSIKNANEGFKKFEENVDKIQQKGTEVRKQFGYEVIKPINVADSPNTVANLKKQSGVYADILGPDMDQETANRKWIAKMYSANNAMLGLSPELRTKYFDSALNGTFAKEYAEAAVNNAKYDNGAMAFSAWVLSKFTAKTDNAAAANKRARSSLIYNASSADKTIAAQQQIAQLRQQYLNKQLTESDYKARAQQIINTTVLNDTFHSLNADDFTAKQILEADPTRFAQYQQAVKNVLNAELQGSIGSITGYLNAIEEMKKNVSAYSSQWWDGIAHIIDGMTYTFKVAGEEVDLAIRSLPNGRIDYSAIVAQIHDTAKKLQLNISDFSNMAASVYQQLLSIGAVHGNYYKDWANFVYENTKDNPVTAADAGAYFDKHIAKGNPNALWGEMNRDEYVEYVKTSSGNQGRAADERRKIRKANAQSIGYAAKRQYDKNTETLRQQQENAKKLANGGSTTGTNNSLNSSGNQKDYASNYGRNAARPTQVIINIDNLCRFDRTAINKDADSRAIAEAVETKVAEAIAMLSASALNSAGAVVAQGLA